MLYENRRVYQKSSTRIRSDGDVACIGLGCEMSFSNRSVASRCDTSINKHLILFFCQVYTREITLRYLSNRSLI